MASFTDIADADITAGKAITQSQGRALRDNTIASHKFLRRSGDHAGVTNSTTLVDDGVLEFTGDANQTYYAKWVVYATASNCGIRTAIDVPADATISVNHVGVEDCGTATLDVTDLTAGYFTTTDDDPFIFGAGGGGNDVQNPGVVIEAIISFVTSGDAKLRYAAAHVDGNTVTVKAGSFLVVIRTDAG